MRKCGLIATYYYYIKCNADNGSQETTSVICHYFHSHKLQGVSGVTTLVVRVTCVVALLTEMLVIYSVKCEMFVISDISHVPRDGDQLKEPVVSVDSRQ